MSKLIKYITRIIKNLTENVRVKISEIASSIVEAGRTISYVETVSDKADTLHRHIKNNSERT